MQTLSYFVAAVALAPAFAARPLLATFTLTCAVASGQRMIAAGGAPHVPVWLWVLLVVAAVCEHLLFWRARPWLDDVPSTARGAFKAVITFMALAGLLWLGADLSTVMTPSEWLFAAVSASGATLFFARAWSGARGLLLTIDPTGALRLRYAVDMGEIVFTVGGVLLAGFSPAPAVAFLTLSAMAALFFLVVGWAWERTAEVKCARCAADIHACALICPACHMGREEAKRASWTGRPKRQRVQSADHQRMQLAVVGRCSFCASPDRPRSLLAPCARCKSAFSAEEAKQFLRAVDRRLPVTLAICAACSAVPVFGLVAGLVFYGLSRPGSIRRYVPWQSRFVARLFVSVATVALALIQPVPLLGILSVPLVCALNYAVDRSAVRLSLRAPKS